MKIERLSDHKIFDAILVPDSRLAAAIPIALAGALVTAVDEATPALWVFTETGRLLAEPGDAIVFDGSRPEIVLKASAKAIKGWRPVPEPKT